MTLADMSPDDIRAELKRLYLQLEIFKSKTICRDNPHISKRRGGRKAQHRRFSLQVNLCENDTKGEIALIVYGAAAIHYDINSIAFEIHEILMKFFNFLLSQEKRQPRKGKEKSRKSSLQSIFI